MVNDKRTKPKYLKSENNRHDFFMIVLRYKHAIAKQVYNL